MGWDHDTAARTLAQEVRGEPPEGQHAVAWVLRNRLASGRWGKTLASVCLWRGQFSGWYVPSDPNFAYACGLDDGEPVLGKMLTVLEHVMGQPAEADPTGGATHYANLDVVTPAWLQGATHCGKFGAHDFYRGVK